MEVRQAVKEQYHAGLAMLAECMGRCPERLWLEGEYPRMFWRIAWHAAYFTHNYMVQNEAAFNASVENWPPAVRAALGVSDTQQAVDIEPYELPGSVSPLTRREVGEYLAYLRGLVDETVDHLDKNPAFPGTQT